MKTKKSVRRVRKFYTGHVDGIIRKVGHDSLKAAFKWIDRRKLIDLAGVMAGNYYIDGPCR